MVVRSKWHRSAICAMRCCLILLGALPASSFTAEHATALILRDTPSLFCLYGKLSTNCFFPAAVRTALGAGAASAAAVADAGKPLLTTRNGNIVDGHGNPVAFHGLGWCVNGLFQSRQLYSSSLYSQNICVSHQALAI